MTSVLVFSRDSLEAEYGTFIALPLSLESALDRAEIQAHLERRTLWTLVDGPCGPLFTSGYHWVNRLAYYRSEKPVPAGIIVDEAPDTTLVPCDECSSWWDSDLYESCPYCEDELTSPHGQAGVSALQLDVRQAEL